MRQNVVELGYNLGYRIKISLISVNFYIFVQIPWHFNELMLSKFMHNNINIVHFSNIVKKKIHALRRISSDFNQSELHIIAHE